MGAVAKIAIGAGLIAASFFIPAGFLVFGKIAASTIIGLGASVALGGVAQALRKPASGTLLNDPRGRLATIRQAAAVRRVAYGSVRVGGVLTFANGTGLRIAPTDQVQLVATLTGHAMDDITSIQFNDQEPEIDLSSGLGLGPWAGKVFYAKKYGLDGDSAFPELISDAPGQWTTSHRQRGCAAEYLRLNFSEQLYPNGVPNITFGVRGKLVFDPRISTPLDITGASNATPIVITRAGHGFIGGEIIRIVGAEGNTAANGTWGVDYIDGNTFSLQGSAGNAAWTSGGQIFELGYSNNAALVIADYLADPWVGMGESWSKINSTALTASANISDEDVDTDAASPPTTEKRYTINGSFETSERPGEVLAQMANAMAGHVVYIGGEWHIIAGAYRLAVMELTDSMIVGPMNVSWKRSRRDLFNAVQGTYAAETQNFVETDFPAVTSATYLAEDRGIASPRDIFLPFTTSGLAAQRIAKIELERNRRQIEVQMVCSMAAYELQPGDVVELTHSRYSWATKTFEVQEAGLDVQEDATGNAAMVVRLKLAEVDVDVYGFAVDDYGAPIDPKLLELLSRTVPFGWTPGLASDIVTTDATLFPFSDYSFSIAQQYRLAGDGSIIPQVRVGGFVPLNVFSQTIQRPRLSTLAASFATSGGFLAGDARYYIAVNALSGLGSPADIDAAKQTALSDIAVVEVSAGSNRTVTLSGLRWHEDTEGWQVYFGTDPFRLSRQPGASFIGSLGSSVTVTGSPNQPDTITFKGFNVPAQIPNGYFEHLGGAPDQRFDRLRAKIYRAPHLGCFGGQVVALGTTGSPAQFTITLNPTTPFTTNVLAGRYITLAGKKNTGLDPIIGGGMPRGNFLIESNDGSTVVLAAGTSTDPAGLMAVGDVVIVRTKVTSVGQDATGHYIQDTGFGEGGQALGDADPNVGGGDDSLKGMLLRIIAGTGAGAKYIIKSNISQGSPTSPDRIYIEGEWDTTPDTTSIFLVTDATPTVVHETDSLTADKVDSYVQAKIDAANLIGENYLIIGVAVSAQGKEAPEESSPFREMYLFGAADGGALITSDYTLLPTDRYVRVNPGANSPAVDITLTPLNPAQFPGIEVLVHNVGTSGNKVYIVPPGSPPDFLIAGHAFISLGDGESCLLRGFND